MLSDFLKHSIGTVLSDRGVYDSQFFEEQQAFGEAVCVPRVPILIQYIDDLVASILEKATSVFKVVLVIYNSDDSKVLEKWIFDVG